MRYGARAIAQRAEGRVNAGSRLPGLCLAAGAPPVAGHAGRGVETVGLGPAPGDEAADLRVRPQRRHVGEAPGDLGLAVAGMDGRMADLVQAHRALVGAPLQLRREVVQAGPGARRYRALAQGADDGRGALGAVRRRVIVAPAAYASSQASVLVALCRPDPRYVAARAARRGGASPCQSLDGRIAALADPGAEERLGRRVPCAEDGDMV